MFKLLKETHGENLQKFLSEKVTPVAGDITYEDMGIQDSTLKEEMWRDIDVVVNVAASTNFDERYWDRSYRLAESDRPMLKKTKKKTKQKFLIVYCPNGQCYKWFNHEYVQMYQWMDLVLYLACNFNLNFDLTSCIVVFLWKKLTNAYLVFCRYDVALPLNTFGARHVMNFAKKCVDIKLFLHVSTG